MMDASTTVKDEPTRHVSTDMLYSLNLKLENNIDEYIVLSINDGNQSDLLETLSKIISEDRIMIVDDIDSSLFHVNSLAKTNIYLIISGKLGQTHVQKFLDNPQIIGLYVYCTNADKHRLWTQGIEKIRCTVSDLEQLTTQLHRDIKQLSRRWPLEEKSFQKALTSTAKWYHIFLSVISHQPKSIEKSRQKMFEECRSYYRINPRRLPYIDRLAETYKPDNAIREYTRDSFLYRITNHALRTQNMEIIRKFSPFIADLHSQIHTHHRKYCHSDEPYIRSVYRGQYLSYDELEYLTSICKSRNPVIKLTTFSSASLDPKIALEFISPARDRIPCLFEIIITDQYKVEHKHLSLFNQAFANISSLSAMPHEQEVIFSLLTHFRVKYVGDSTVPSHRFWVPVVLELVKGNGKTNYTHSHIVESIENETNPTIYSSILDVLQANAEDQENFHEINWKKWWNKFTNLWSTDQPHEQPLLLTLYDSFTDDKYYLRKAIEMHKDIQRLNDHQVLDSSSFSHKLKRFKGMKDIPSKGIAFYEQYLKPYCTTNSKDVIDCLYFAGEMYQVACDNERVLESYQKIFDIDVDNEHQMHDKVQQRLKQLKKSIKTINRPRIVVEENMNKDSRQIYQAQEDQWEMFWALDYHKKKTFRGRATLDKISDYFTKREQWYDDSDSKILFRLSCQANHDASIEFYRFHSMLAIQRHVLYSGFPRDSSNDRSLSRWRYERYMHEWILLTNLDTFFKKNQEKSTFIRLKLLPQLNQLISKLTVLITVCVAYICINKTNGKFNVNNIRFINMTNTNAKQLPFFDLNDKGLLDEFKVFQDPTQASLPSFTMAPDAEKFLAAYD